MCQIVLIKKLDDDGDDDDDDDDVRLVFRTINLFDVTHTSHAL